jgi:type III pantothenate kinase
VLDRFSKKGDFAVGHGEVSEGNGFGADSEKKQVKPSAKPRTLSFHVVDVGNTLTKWGWVKGRKVFLRGRCPTDHLTEAWIQSFFRETLEAPIVLSSVVPGVIPLFKSGAKGAPVLSLTHQLIKNILPLRYPKPEELGTDRLANALALRAMARYPAVAVDIGTAITFDVLDSRGVFCGGVIAPGPSVARDYLAERTAQLGRISLSGKSPRRAIGKSTQEALWIGLLCGWRGLLCGILKRIAQDLKAPPTVVVTGGNARLLFPKPPPGWRYAPLLTLEGLRAAGQYWLQEKQDA